jgi:hypothetical protein
VRLRGSCCRGRIVGGLEKTDRARKTAVRARTARLKTSRLAGAKVLDTTIHTYTHAYGLIRDVSARGLSRACLRAGEWTVATAEKEEDMSMMGNLEAWRDGIPL